MYAYINKNMDLGVVEETHSPSQELRFWYVNELLP
jgi:hypothetical protein